MELVLVRHGVAEDAGPATGGRDEPRRLTPDGAERMRLAAEGLVTLGLRPDVVLTSPVVCCVETARILCDALGGEPIEDDRLRPGMGLAELAEALAALATPPGGVLACGHQPDLSQVTSALLGGGRIEFRKGAAVVVEVRELRPGGAFLRAAYPPAALRQLAP